MTEHPDDDEMDDERLQGADLDRLYDGDEEDDTEAAGWDGLEDDLEEEP